MKIKNVITGVISNERADIARALIRQGLCEVIGGDEGDGTVTAPSRMGHETYRLPKPGDAVIPQPEFAVLEYSGAERTFLVIQLRIGARVDLWSGDPKKIPARVGGWPVPKEIAAEYKTQFKRFPALRDAKAHIIGDTAAIVAARTPGIPDPFYAKVYSEVDQIEAIVDSFDR
jgi:hypothetical protein